MKHQSIAAVASIVLPLTLVAAPAVAKDGAPDANGIAATVAAASPDGAQAARPVMRGSAAVASTAASEVRIPLDAGRPLSLGHEKDALEISVALPGADSLDRGVVAGDGTVVFQGASEATVAVQALTDGRLRVQTVLASAAAPTAYTYTVGGDVDLLPRPDGGIDLVVSDQALQATVVVGEVAAPWATDAAGNAVATYYTVEGANITQHVTVTPNTVFPVTADPTYTFGWWYYAHFNRAETKTIANGGWGATGIAGICTVLGGPIAGAYCLAQVGSIVYTAGVAENSSPKRCLYLKYPYWGGSIVYMGTYKDYRCA